MRQFCLLGTLVSMFLAVPLAAQSTTPGTVHTYYVAADEVEWNYTPLGVDRTMGTPFMGYATLFTERGPHRIGSYLPQGRLSRIHRCDLHPDLSRAGPEWEHLGILGPVLRGEVGDTIKVVFKNNATHPFSMHPHGVFYVKESEGAGYQDGSSGANKNGVPPGQTHTYTWEVPERAGPRSQRSQFHRAGSITRTPMSRRTWRAD